MIRRVDQALMMMDKSLARILKLRSLDRDVKTELR